MNFKKIKLARLYLALPALGMFMACGHSNNVTLQRKAILALHDSVMALNSPLVAQEIQLDSIATGKTTVPTALVTAARRQQKMTNAVVDSMDTWMQHFNPETGNKNLHEAQAYLATELKKLTMLKHSYQAAITRNKAVLDSVAKGKFLNGKNTISR